MYIKLSTKQIAESDKILAWAVSQTKTQFTSWVFAPKVYVHGCNNNNKITGITRILTAQWFVQS